MSSLNGLRLAFVALLVLPACGSKPNAEGGSKSAVTGRAGEPRVVKTAQAAEQRFEKSLDVLGHEFAAGTRNLIHRIEQTMILEQFARLGRNLNITATRAVGCARCR